jgi:hypothetical protein
MSGEEKTAVDGRCGNFISDDETVQEALMSFVKNSEENGDALPPRWVPCRLTAIIILCSNGFLSTYDSTAA